MKILFVSGFVPYPPVSGNLQRNFNLIREISKKNQIDLIALAQRGLHPDEDSLQKSIETLKKYCRIIGVFKIPLEYSRIKWYLFLFANLFSITPFTVWKFCCKEMHKEIRKMIDRHKYDVVHFDSSDVAQYHFVGLNTPSLLNHHNIESSLLMRRSSNLKNPLKRLYLYLQGNKLKRYEGEIAGKFDLNICVSEADADELRRISPKIRVCVVPNGTDTEYFKPDPGAESARLIFAGPLSWYPNAEAMIHMCRNIYTYIKAKTPDIQLDIIGHSPPTTLKELAARDNSIHLHGFVDDIRPYLARAAIYVVPLRIGGGTRLKILDAMACGKAVVSTSIGCEGLKIEDGKNILIADSPEKFAECVTRLLENEQLRKKLETNGRHLVEEKYSWTMIGRHLEGLYGSISGK